MRSVGRPKLQIGINNPKKITCVCDVCGDTFTKYKSLFHNQKRKLKIVFCSRSCFAKYIGLNYGKKAFKRLAALRKEAAVRFKFKIRRNSTIKGLYRSVNLKRGFSSNTQKSLCCGSTITLWKNTKWCDLCQRQILQV
jgi:hypothetical protein